MPTAVAFGLTEVFAYAVLPVIRLFVDVARPMPCRPLWWLLEPVTVTPLEAYSRIPVDSALSTAAARMVIELFGQVSTRTPLLADCDAVTWSTVIADDDSSRTPARFAPVRARGC